MPKSAHFCPLTAYFGGFEGASFINAKSATLYPDKARLADVLSFKECNRSRNEFAKNIFFLLSCDII